MKKTLIALAAVAVSSAAMAQVTISGTFGMGYQSYENPAQAAGTACSNSATGGTFVTGSACTAGAAAATAKGTQKGMAVSDSSVRVTASEDIAGVGRATAFVQFAQPASRGTALTKEDSALALATGFGTISLSNTRSSNVAIGANVFASSLPYTTFYGSSVGAGVASRANGDLMSYSTPAMSGLTLGVAQFEMSEGVLTSAAKVNILSANYAQGPLAIAFASKSKNQAALTAAGTTAKKTENELSLTYDLGVARVGLGYSSKRTSTDKALTSYGVSVPMGAITIGVNGAKRGTAEFVEGGLKYAFSKRTTLNAMYGSYEMNEVAAKAETKAAVGTGKIDAIKGNQYRVGIVHTF